jgi:hypothetical protein
LYSGLPRSCREHARGGRSAEEHLVAALRCLYRRAVDDGLITQADNPARKVAKPRRLPTNRRALPDTRLAEINQIAATTGDDPELDTLLAFPRVGRGGTSPDTAIRNSLRAQYGVRL